MSRTYEYYDVTGGGDVITSGFPDVFHYDPSTFYNHTQDNLAATGLEVRDRLLAQAMGFPGSGTYSGVTLLVSSTATANSELGIYTTVQAAVDDVPRVLNYPVNIEIADYGNLGALNITGIKCHGDGALQIQVLNQGSDTSALVTEHNVYEPPLIAEERFSVTTSASSLTIESALPEITSQRTGVSPYNATTWAASGRAIGQQTPDSQKEGNGAISFVDPAVALWTFSSSSKGFTVDNYYNISQTGKDFSTSAGPFAAIQLNGVDTSGLAKNYRVQPTASDSMCISLYGAFFSGIEIKDCNKVKLKGVMVDGSLYDSYVRYTQDTGLYISNSSVLLEDVAVVRCKTTGILANNSNVSVVKSLAVYRILRQGDGNSQFTDNDANLDNNSRGIGIFLDRSNLIFDTSSTEGSGKYMRTVAGGCQVGIQAINSSITGGSRDTETGNTYSKNAGGLDTRTAHLQSCGNVLGYGLWNSVVDFDGRLDSFLNLSGCTTVNSEVSLPMFSVDDNEGPGFYLENSTLYYGKFASFINNNGGTSGLSGIPLFHCDWNSVNLQATNNSTVAIHPNVPQYSDVGTWGGNTVIGTGISQVSSCSLMRNHGIANAVAGVAEPSINILQQSNADIVGLGYIGNASDYRSAGMALKISENSSARLLGFEGKWTTITSWGSLSGAQELQNNWGSAAIYARDNSKIDLLGPTKISRFGVDVLCEGASQTYVGFPSDSGINYDLYRNVASNSDEMEVEKESLPYRDAGTARFASKYGLLASGNHTCAELHSSRACLVANHESTVKLYGLGASADSSSVYQSPGMYQDTSAGYIAFLPNGFTENIRWGTTLDTVEADKLNRYARNAGLLTDYEADHDDGTTGGMCIRAVNDSAVEVDLVDFKFGASPSSVSGSFYNWYGSGLEFIDNMDNFTPLSNTTHTCWIAQYCCECAQTTVTTSTAPSISTTLPSITPSPVTTTTTTGITTTTTTTPSTVTTTPSTTTTTLSTTTTTTVEPTTTTTTTSTSTTPSTTQTLPTTTTTTTTTIPPTTTTTTSSSTTPSTTTPSTTTTENPTTTTVATTTTPTTTTPSTTTTSPTTTTTPSTTTTTPATTTTTTTVATTTTTTTTSPTTTTTPSTTSTIGTPPPITITPLQQELSNIPALDDTRGQAAGGTGEALNYEAGNDFTFSGFGSRIHMWNVCDTSRIRVARVLINKINPLTACWNNNWHGPTGRWYNGATCDYYGKYGLYSENQWEARAFRNQGIFRLMMGVNGDLKSYVESSYDGDAGGHTPLPQQSTGLGSPVDQLNAQGYQTAFDIGTTLPGTDVTSATIVNENASEGLSGVSYMFGGGLAGYYQEPGKVNGVWTHASMKEGALMKFQVGELHPAFVVPPLGMRWEGYLDNMLDESALSTFANAKHAGNKKISLISVYRSNKLPYDGGEGRDGLGDTVGREISFGQGVRSLNIFELKQLV